MRGCLFMINLIWSEICDRVARCCFDYESPFSKYEFPCRDLTFDRSIDLVKFRASDPVVFPACIGSLSSFPWDVGLAIIQFYSALDRWNREVDDLVLQETARFSPDDVVRLQRRLGEVFPFAINVRLCMDSICDNWKNIEVDAFIAIYGLAVDERSYRDLKNPGELIAKLSDSARRSKEREREHEEGNSV